MQLTTITAFLAAATMVLAYGTAPTSGNCTSTVGGHEATAPSCPTCTPVPSDKPVPSCPTCTPGSVQKVPPPTCDTCNPGGVQKVPPPTCDTCTPGGDQDKPARPCDTCTPGSVQKVPPPTCDTCTPGGDQNKPARPCNTCNPVAGQNKCHITTSCINTGSTFHCACRAGYKASQDNNNIHSQFRLNMPNYEFLVFVPENTACDTLCDNPYTTPSDKCSEVTKWSSIPV